MTKSIFVFGSNLAGMHGGGSARAAIEHHGAIFGQGIGRQGDSYAIPTLDGNLFKLSLDEIKKHVSDFIGYARQNPGLTFDVVAIGCGIAGFTPADIAPMFSAAPKNVNLPEEFRNARVASAR